EKSINRAKKLIANGAEILGEPELARVNADLIRASGAPADVIDKAYCEALEKARTYPNKYYELRTCCGFAEHYENTGRTVEARGLLTAICDSITDPIEIPDLIAAKTLLSRLRN
ncbi:MAG: hypothetical protein ACI8XC_003348, partial [Gammaproteobacteria bacterium]